MLVDRQAKVPWRMGVGEGDYGVRGGGGSGGGNGKGDEFIAGPPYIPPRAPERTFGSLRRDFF